jgi:hypothetical protein
VGGPDGRVPSLVPILTIFQSNATTKTMADVKSNGEEEIFMTEQIGLKWGDGGGNHCRSANKDMSRGVFGAYVEKRSIS